jgi:cytoskeletal protein RodZ
MADIAYGEMRNTSMTLGLMIAKVRKDTGLSIDDLAGATNIRPALLREIEKNDFSHCGGLTYARGHVRNIAIALKADPKEFLRIYDEEQGIEHRTMRDLLVENSVMREPSDRQKVSLKTLLLISIACLGIAGLVQIVLSNTSLKNSVAPTPKASASPSVTASASQSPSVTPSQQSSFSTGTGVEVIISAVRDKSWLFVSDGSGRTLFSGQISRGDIRSFSSDERLDLKVGNAGGVDLQVNGNEIGAIGIDGEVVSVSYGVDS